ncbi:helix-turn-helix transcriptional regulator [Rufibacter glacialis]|nr:WYL domain-containing protein [Rufibacter glacialis]
MRIIDECLRNKTGWYWSKEQLIARILEKSDIMVSERTLDNDIYLMRHCTQLNYKAPIKYLKKFDGYVYTEPDYSIEKLPLNEAEIAALAMAAATFSQYRHVRVLSGFASTVDKVITLVNQIRKEGAEEPFRFIDFEKAPYSVGNEHIDFIIESIRSRKPIALSHRSFDQPLPKDRTVSPYLLKEYRNRWYLLGFQHEDGKLRKFGLDRIVSIGFAEGTRYVEPKDFDPELYFRNTIGISLEDSEVTEVILSFSPHDGNYVKTQHLHSSQETLVDDGKEFRIRLRVVLNYELVSTILGFGKGVLVLSPERLKDQISDVLEDRIKHYRNM